MKKSTVSIYSGQSSRSLECCSCRKYPAEVVYPIHKVYNPSERLVLIPPIDPLKPANPVPVGLLVMGSY